MTERLDLLLVYPPWAVSEERGNSIMNCLPPLGILSIAAYAESKGLSVGGSRRARRTAGRIRKSSHGSARRGRA